MGEKHPENGVERTFYPNGQLRREVPYVDGKITGAVRLWSDAGVLLSEMEHWNSQLHGVSREWQEDGTLRNSGEYQHGVGIFRTWYPNGQLHGEMGEKSRVPHGRSRSWDEEGELVVEQYFVLGRKVSKKKYLEACASDPELPRYEMDAGGASPVDPTPEDEVEASPPSEANYDDARDALEWLGESSDDCLHALGELGSAEESIELVQEFLSSGASRVLAVQIDVEEDLQNTGQLLVELPTQKSKRKSVLQFCNEKNAEQGFEPQKDTGQRYVHVGLD